MTSTGVQPLVEERVSFGRGISLEVNALPQQAAANTHDFAAGERALLQARALASQQLEVFIALYKLYFYRGFTDAAEQAPRSSAQCRPPRWFRRRLPRADAGQRRLVCVRRPGPRLSVQFKGSVFHSTAPEQSPRSS